MCSLACGTPVGLVSGILTQPVSPHLRQPHGIIFQAILHSHRERVDYLLNMSWIWFGSVTSWRTVTMDQCWKSGYNSCKTQHQITICIQARGIIHLSVLLSVYPHYQLHLIPNHYPCNKITLPLSTLSFVISAIHLDFFSILMRLDFFLSWLILNFNRQMFCHAKYFYNSR